MAIKSMELPLFSDPMYSYSVSILTNTYNFTFLYNTRMEKWTFSISEVGGDGIISGALLVPGFPILIDHDIGFPGILYLESKGMKQGEALINPFEINQFYNLYFVYDDKQE